MRRRLPPAPPEMPARLRSFDPAEWGADRAADRNSAELREALSRYNDACMAWGRANGIDPVDILQQRRRDRGAF